VSYAQFERELISERTRDKMLERARKGLWNCGHTPFGYKRENKKLAIDPNEAKIINVIYRSFVSTASIGRVYQTLKSRKLFGRNNMPLTKSTITGILRNGVVYLGKTKYKDTIYDDILEPIISENMYARTQEIRKYRVKKTRVFNNSLFPGLIHCKECGSIMTAVFTNKFKGSKRKRYYYYRCTCTYKRDWSMCSIKQVSASKLDNYVIQNFERITRDNQYLESLSFTLNHNNEGGRAGLEPRPLCPAITTESIKESLENVVKIVLNKEISAKEKMLNNHIKNIIYSKEAIEIKLYNSKKEISNQSRKIERPKMPPSIFGRGDTPIFGVCRKGMARLNFVLPTVSLIIPNTVHGCKLKNIGRL